MGTFVIKKGKINLLLFQFLNDIPEYLQLFHTSLFLQ